MTEMRLCAVTEALCHSAHPWTDETHDRLALFTCFDTVNQKWGTERTPPEVVMSMAPKRRSLFRAVNAVNKEYDPEFPASQCERSRTPSAPLPSPLLSLAGRAQTATAARVPSAMSCASPTPHLSHRRV